MFSIYIRRFVVLFRRGIFSRAVTRDERVTKQIGLQYHYLGSCPVVLQMNLARHSISATEPLVLYDVRFDADCQIFTASSPEGFAVYRVLPLDLLKKRGKYRLTITPDYG